MHKQPSNRGRRRPWTLVKAAGAAVLLAVLLAGVGYLCYLQWTASRAVTGQGQDPVPPPPDRNNESMPPPPPKSSDKDTRDWQKLAEMRQPPPQAPRLHSTDDLIAAVDAAFAGPAAELKPAVVFFPIVDGVGKVRADGAVLGLMASFAAT